MTRNISAGFQAQVEGDTLSPFYAVEMTFTDDNDTVLRYWTGYGEITFDGETFSGFADFLNIEVASETTDLQANGASITLSGLNAATVSLALGEPFQGEPIKIWLGVLNTSGQVIADPYMIFEGKMDTMSIAQAADKSSVTITAESSLIDLNRTRVRRYTSEDQKIEYPNDRGLDFVPSIQQMDITWGRKT